MKQNRYFTSDRISYLSDEQLLELKLCELVPYIQTNPLVTFFLTRVQEELRARLQLPLPRVWWADEWCCPDGYYGIGIPFYLGHPRLIELEVSQIGEAEGASMTEGLKIFRHDVGHAFENGFALRRNRLRQQVFGKSSLPYPKKYIYKPYSHQYVRNLPNGYAQSHPTEDFAETFAVWLEHKNSWRRKYQGWGALKKLEFMENLMEDIVGRRPHELRASRPYDIKNLSITLGQHYRLRRRHTEVKSSPLTLALKEIGSESPLHSQTTNSASASQVYKDLCLNIPAPKYRLRKFVQQFNQHCRQHGTTLCLDRQKYPSKSLPILIKAAKLYLEQSHDAIYL